VKNNRFTSRKRRMPPSKLNGRERGSQILLHHSNFTSFAKCANTNKCSPPCARVLAFSQLFSQRS
jgi:hypothetical protein